MTTDKDKKTLIGAEVDFETREKIIAYANKETDGNISAAVRKILREFLSKYKVRG